MLLSAQPWIHCRQPDFLGPRGKYRRNYNRNRHPDRKHPTDSLCFTLHEHLCTLFFKEKFKHTINLL